MPPRDADNEAHKFVNYYDSNGWRVGRNPMKSWKGAVANWLRNWSERNASKGLGHGGRAFHQTTREEAERLNCENWGGDAPKWEPATAARRIQ